MSTAGRVLVVAFDAADPALVVELAGSGQMPAVRSLLDRGTANPLETPPGIFVGAIWPTLATGVSAARHGRYCYAQLRPGSYEVHRVGGSIIPYEPFWTRAARKGHVAAVLDVPHSDLDRTLALSVVDWSRHDPDIGFRAWPREIEAQVLERYGPLQNRACNDHARRNTLDVLRTELIASVRHKADFVETTLSSDDWDLFTVVFGESHCAGHQFWALHDPSHPAHDAKRAGELGDPLVEIYAELDAALARIVAAAGPDALVLLLLSHGMGPHYDATKMLPEMLRRAEFTDARAGRLVAGRERALRAVERVRRVRRGQDGFAYAVDGSRRFFAVPNNDACGAVRINVAGREPRGRVRAGTDYDAECRRVEDTLAEWRNVETGEPVVRAVLRTDDCYDGPARDHLPDLLVEWNRTAPIRCIASPRSGRIDRYDTSLRSGDHRSGGLLVARGPGAPSPSQSMAAVDLAPTILGALDVDFDDLDGRSLIA